MVRFASSIVNVAFLLYQSAGASPSEVKGPILDFASPQNVDRPKFRYWFPDASVSTTVIANDVETIKDVGGGGLELLSFYNYGQGPPLTNWSTYGFGTPAFKEVLRAALNASAEYGLVFDFALGPNQGQGVPSVPATPGLAYELVYGVTEVGAGQIFSGLVPPANPHFNYEPLTSFINPPQVWGENKLVAVVAAKVVSTSGSGSVSTMALEESSAIDLTNLTISGRLTWTPPASNGTYSLFAFYERYTNEQNCVSVPDAQTWLGNGSWMVDHFSATGAKRMTDFWDHNLFDDDDIKSLLRKAGEYSWEDSMEMMAALWWTPGFLDRFEKSRGYSAIKYLPVMFQASNLWNGYSPPYNTTYISDTDLDGTGGKYLQDYKTTLNEGYQEYLQYFQEWAKSLGLGHSAQPAYNLPLDMQADIPILEAPELESLGFDEDIDLYRQFTGPAHLAGRSVISTEIGARRIGAYALTVPALAGLFQDSYAVGVNTMVIHGFPYTGEYVQTTWPGYTPFQYEFTEMWGPRMPAWRHFSDAMLYAARNTVITKTGVPKVDLAFYYSSPSSVLRDIYPGSDLTRAGYTHEYLGPANLASANVTVSGGMLAPDGPAYKALVIYNQTSITSAASAALVGFARAGLPIIIAGPVPRTSLNSDDQAEVSANMESLIKLPSVEVMSAGCFSPAYLSAKGIAPRASVTALSGSNNASLYTFWRRNESAGFDAVYVLNRGKPDVFNITFAVAGNSLPWELDAWTGSQARIATYKRTNDSVTLTVSLQQSQTKIFVFARGETPQAVHAVSHSDNIRSLHLSTENKLEAIVQNGNTATVALSDGTIVTLPTRTSPPANLSLGPWNLTIESFEPFPNASAQGHIITLPRRPLTMLVPWTQIPNLQNISGIGTYETTFSFPSNLTITEHQILLHFGPILNTLRAWLNSNILPPVEFADPVSDITSLLRSGLNTLRIEVSSTLFNAVKARLPTILSAGGPARVPDDYTKANWASFGLVGPVEVEFLRRVPLVY